MGEWSATAYLICYIVIIIFTWILNVLLTVGIYRSRQLFLCRRNKKISTTFKCSNSNSGSGSSGRNEFAQLANYYFITSICLSNVISVCFNPPSFIMLNWFHIKPGISSMFCLIHSSINTFLCNLAFLHVLCSSLDTFLRLRNPRLYIDSQRSQTTVLKITAPWIVTTIQSACQLTINNQNAVAIKNSLCLLNDGNFLILRSVISYAVPLIVCVILIVLQIVYLRFLTSINLTNLRYLIRSYNQNRRSTVTNADDGQITETETMTQSSPIPSASETNNNANTDETNPILPALMDAQETSRILKHNCPKHGLISFPMSIDDRAVTSTSVIPSYDIRDPLDSSLMKSVSFEMPDVTNQAKQANLPSLINMNNNNIDNNCINNNNIMSENSAPAHKKMWLRMYKTEQLSIALNMVMCIISIGIWSPLMLSTLAYKLCEESPCTIHILVDRIHDFEWWAFAGGLIYPCAFILIDSNIRRSLRLDFFCRDVN